jgi:hypothetical protein
MERINNDDVFELTEGDYYDENTETEDNGKLTSEQKKEFQYKKATVKLLNTTSKFLNRYPDMLARMRLIIRNQSEIKTLQAEIDQHKPLLKKAMLQFFKPDEQKKLVLDNKSFTISERGCKSTKKFDEEKFKREQPALYERYCYRTYTGGCGGTLSVRDVTDKQKMYIKSIQNEAAKYEE